MQVSQNRLLHRNVDFMNCEKIGETDKFVKPEIECKDRWFDAVNNMKAISKEPFDNLSEHWLDKHQVALFKSETVTMVRKLMSFQLCIPLLENQLSYDGKYPSCHIVSTC